MRMKQLLGYILLDKHNIKHLHKDVIINNISIFNTKDFLINSIKVCNAKDKYYVCRVYKYGDCSDSLYMLPSNDIVPVIFAEKCIIGTPRYVGRLDVWKDMYYHGVCMQSNNMELRKWLLMNIQNKLSIEPRFKYNPVLEMLSKLDQTDSISSSKSIEDAFDEEVHINDFDIKYKRICV